MRISLKSGQKSLQHLHWLFVFRWYVMMRSWKQKYKTNPRRSDPKDEMSVTEYAHSMIALARDRGRMASTEVFKVSVVEHRDTRLAGYPRQDPLRSRIFWHPSS